MAIFLVILFYSLVKNYLKSILLTLGVILIHGALFLIFVQLSGDAVGNTLALETVQNTKTLLNISLVIFSLIIGTVLLQKVKKSTYIYAFIRVLTSTLLSILLVYIMQRFLGLSSILFSFIFFHLFFAAFLYIIAVRTSNMKIIDLAQVLRVTFFLFVIVGIIIYIGSFILHF